MRVGTWPATNPTGKIFLRTNSLDRVTIDEAGDVGVGVTAPLSRLHIKGGMRLESTNNTTGAIFNLYGGTDNLSYIQFYKNLTTPQRWDISVLAEAEIILFGPGVVMQSLTATALASIILRH